jgi:hypothetical protein
MELSSIIFLTVFIEGFVEFLFAPFSKLKPYLGYVALLFGVGLTITYQIDLLAMVGITTAHTIISYAISGLIIGRGSNYLNDIITKFGNK